MNRLWLLTKTLFKNSREAGNDSKKKIKNALLVLLILASLSPLMIGFVILMNDSYNALYQIHQEGVLLGLGIAVTCMAIFFFGIFQVISTFYFSKDVEYLLPLPLKPWHILGAKFSIVLFYEYITEAFFLLPVIIEFGVKSSASPIYYIYGIVIFAALPLIPIILAALLSMIIMRFTNIGKHKEAFKVVGGVIAMAVGLSVNFAMQNVGRSTKDSAQMIQALLQGNNSFVSIITKLFPTSKFAVQSLLKCTEASGFLYLLVFLMISIALFAAMLVLSQSLYFKGVIGVSETFSRRKKLSENELTKSTIKSSAMMSYTMKEIKLLFRTSVYFINCVLMNFIWPVFFIPVLLQKNTMSDIRNMSVLFKSPKSAGAAIAYIMLFLIFILSCNAIAGTSISREGKGFYTTKYLPMPYKNQLMAKVYSQIILNMASLVIAVVFIKVLINVPVYVLSLVTVLGIMISFFAAMSGILIDINSPKLHWDNEQKAVKQNYNVLIDMLVCFAVGGALTFLIVYFEIKLWPAFAILAIAFAASDIILYNLICTKGVKAFRNLEG